MELRHESWSSASITLLAAFALALLTYRVFFYLSHPYTTLRSTRSTMLSQKVYDLCHAKDTVSSELARDPSLAPGAVIKKLYGHDAAGHDEHKQFKEPQASAEDLQKASECGKWGSTRPSDLFLKVLCHLPITSKLVALTRKVVGLP